MSKDDDIPLSELLKPLSAKVQPKHPSWGSESISGSRQGGGDMDPTIRDRRSQAWRLRNKIAKAKRKRKKKGGY